MRERHTDWPHLEHYSNVPLFNTKAVVQQTGITAPTLRAWERRYMILSPERGQNDYRLYSERDIAIIRWLKERVDAGMSISQAVALFRHLEEEHRQLQGETLPLASSSLPPSSLHAQRNVAQGGEQEEDEREKQDISPVTPHNGQDVAASESANTSLETYDMRFVQERLLTAFNRLDEAMASQLMAVMLAIYPLEQVCAELIKPTLWEVGRLWEQGLITVSIEHFASAFFRGLLTNLFHTMSPTGTGPLIITCCAPGEEHELAALMLSLLLRRAGLHIAYLGQSIEINGLLQTIRQLSPALVCISATFVTCIGIVTELADKLQRLPPPRPTLVFGGQAFEQHTECIERVPGVYLDGELPHIISQLKRMVIQSPG
jgi:MerR family transcriptional regulator, light-induced transcriptional regulator